MTTNLIGETLTPDELAILEVYGTLKTLLAGTDLAPSTEANLRDALASLSIVVTDLVLDYETLHDQWV